MDDRVAHDRVLVRGASGSGKSTFAAALAAAMGVVHVELDALHHLPDWRERDDDEFAQLVAQATSVDRWVVDGNYLAAMPIVRARTQLVVWLDLPRWRVMGRVTRRTLWRGIRREELWHGNRESLRTVLSPDPERNIIAWAWASWPRRHAEALAAETDPEWAHATVVRLVTPDAVARFLDDL